MKTASVLLMVIAADVLIDLNENHQPWLGNSEGSDITRDLP